MNRKTTLTLAASMFALTMVLVPNAKADCGGYQKPQVHPSGWQPQFGQARLLLAAMNNEPSFEDGNVSIVGLWHVKLFSDGVTTGIPGGIPEGAEVDAGYSEWHSDGTEIMNSGGRAPSTSAFCLGVWSQVAPRQYLLNHFAASWDPTPTSGNPNGTLIGPTSIRELVTVAPNGKSFTGAFTIDNYDETNTLQSHLEGTITGSRIDVTTPPSSIF